MAMTPTAALDAAMEAARKAAPFFDRLCEAQAEARDDPAALARYRAERALGEAARHAVRAGMDLDELDRLLGTAWARAVAR